MKFAGINIDNRLFRFAAQQNCFFRDNLSRHYFFATKTIFKAQSVNRIFFSPKVFSLNNYQNVSKFPVTYSQTWVFPSVRVVLMIFIPSLFNLSKSSVRSISISQVCREDELIYVYGLITFICYSNWCPYWNKLFEHLTCTVITLQVKCSNNLFQQGHQFE